MNFLQKRIVIVVRVGFGSSHNGIFVDKPNRIVNMPVGIVADNTFVNPKHLLNAVEIAEVFFDLGLGQVSISVLI